MSHEHDHDHDHHAAPRQPSRPGPARGRAGTGQPALSPQEEQLEHALLLHQAHHLLREAHQRAAARAGASTDAAPAARDGHTTSAGATHAAHAGEQAQDRDHFSQVQADLAAGNVAAALGLLDTYWPASARDRAEARAYVGGLIVARLHATLAPLPMDRMLHTLEPVRPRLDEVLTAGHRLRDLLFAAAHGLDRDRLAFAFAALTGRADFLNEGKNVSEHHYLVEHYQDFVDAVAYFHSAGANSLDSLQPPQAYKTKLGIANDKFAATVHNAIADAVASIGPDPVSWAAWLGSVAGTLIGGAGCLALDVNPITIYIGTVVTAATVLGATSLPASPLTPAQVSFANQVGQNMGSQDDKREETNYSRIQAQIENVVHTYHGKAQEKGNRWTDDQAFLQMLRHVFKPEFLLVTGGGLVDIDTGAIYNHTKRTLLLGAVDKTGAGGHLVYEYSATNVFYRDEVDGAPPVYNHPAGWKYQLDKTVLAAPPQLVTTLTQEQARQPIASGDVDAPVEIIVTTTGTPSHVFLHLDYRDAVTGLAPRPLYWWDGQNIRPLETSEQEWGQALKTFAWVATTGQGERPQEQVSAVAQEQGGVL